MRTLSSYSGMDKIVSLWWRDQTLPLNLNSSPSNFALWVVEGEGASYQSQYAYNLLYRLKNKILTTPRCAKEINKGSFALELEKGIRTARRVITRYITDTRKAPPITPLMLTQLSNRVRAQTILMIASACRVSQFCSLKVDDVCTVITEDKKEAVLLLFRSAKGWEWTSDHPGLIPLPCVCHSRVHHLCKTTPQDCPVHCVRTVSTLFPVSKKELHKEFSALGITLHSPRRTACLAFQKWVKSIDFSSYHRLLTSSRLARRLDYMCFWASESRMFWEYITGATTFTSPQSLYGAPGFIEAVSDVDDRFTLNVVLAPFVGANSVAKRAVHFSSIVDHLCSKGTLSGFVVNSTAPREKHSTKTSSILQQLMDHGSKKSDTSSSSKRKASEIRITKLKNSKEASLNVVSTCSVKNFPPSTPQPTKFRLPSPPRGFQGSPPNGAFWTCAELGIDYW